MSLFGAGWTLGAIKHLAEQRAARATFYETTGWLGVMESEAGPPLPERFPSRPGQVFPMFHVFADVNEFRGGEVLPSRSTRPLAVDGLVLAGAIQARSCWPISRRKIVEIRIDGLGRQARIRRLDATNALQDAEAARRFRAEPGSTMRPRGRLHAGIGPVRPRQARHRVSEGPMSTSGPKRRCRIGPSPCWLPARSASGSRESGHSRGSTWRSVAARSMPWWERTGRARARSCISWPGSIIPTAGPWNGTAGEFTAFGDEREAQRAGVAIVFQERSLFGPLSIAENIFAARQPVGRWGLIDRRELRRRSVDLLARVGLDADPETPVERLSPAQQQLVEIAKALSIDARLIIFDEPTAALTAAETESLFAVIRQLRERRLGVIYISHRLEEVFQIADRVTVLKDGSGQGTFLVREVTSRDLVARMVGRGLDPHRPRQGTPPADSPVALEVRGLSDAGHAPGTRPRFRDITLEVRCGEIVALAGLVGAGRTELALGIFGGRAGRVRRSPRHGPAGRPEVPGRGDRGRHRIPVRGPQGDRALPRDEHRGQHPRRRSPARHRVAA